jgi:hypothetical protein
MERKRESRERERDFLLALKKQTVILGAAHGEGHVTGNHGRPPASRQCKPGLSVLTSVRK